MNYFFKKNNANRHTAVRFLYKNDILDDGIDWGEKPEAPQRKKITQMQHLKTYVKELVQMALVGGVGIASYKGMVAPETAEELRQILGGTAVASLPTLVGVGVFKRMKLWGYDEATYFFNEEWEGLPKEKRETALSALINHCEAQIKSVPSETVRRFLMKQTLQGMALAAKQADVLQAFKKAKQKYKEGQI